jgi:hypothetical protein
MFISVCDENSNLPKNKVFHDVHREFLENGWELRDNTMAKMVYCNPTCLTDEFKIRFENKIIYVTIPMTPGNYEYTTKFTSYFLATEYISFHIKNYVDKMNVQ